jgi:hypothetical protein
LRPWDDRTDGVEEDNHTPKEETTRRNANSGKTPAALPKNGVLTTPETAS